MSVESAFNGLQVKMNVNPEEIQRLNAVYQFNLSEGKVYQVSFNDGHVNMENGEKLDPQCTLQLSDENVLKLIDGSFNTTMAFMTGKLKVTGDIGLALKLQSALEKYK
ncbi:SCP2 sterol-binding domain-containing protein [Sutcliffiella rhizosphaerae]|uniref:Ubiquinone biosynthesis accessory factor UbiJ n=1 Tax=Sutcliffiella rhizosphaerae TaxID=2880967 RepID=A0ABM8YL22_9BACI|nr:SCP2 sterol-binding domain-containing protein [Sutcliffiella rhizosphaerae]CAG9620495.1 Ubiquinone biosynthesis accessory factor UbiJ [Sutcliffiella rhizosphaerae]